MERTNHTTTPPTPSVISPRPISLGCVTFGREIDELAACALMDHAQRHGVTHFDTAATYAHGASESMIGTWLASRRPKPGTLSIATKIYPPYTPGHIDAAVAASAARLRMDTLDLLYLHKWDATAETPEALHALDRLVRAGRVRLLGLSNFTAAQAGRVIELQQRLALSPVRVLQNNNNFAVRDVDEPLLALCAAHAITLVTYSPLGAGFLTGKHRSGVHPGSRFAVSPGHQDIYFTPPARHRLAQLSEASSSTGRSMTHLALLWALRRPGVASVLVGARTTAHLDQAFAALASDEPDLLAGLDDR